MRQKAMPDLPSIFPLTPKVIGIAADHGGFELKQFLVDRLREEGYQLIDFGDGQPSRMMIIPITSCPLRALFPVGKWNEAWPFAEAV